MLLLGIVFSNSPALMLFYDAITLRDILKANGSLLKFYSVLQCDTLITMNTVGQKETSERVAFWLKAKPTNSGHVSNARETSAGV
jgi:hypothetical protein